MFKFIKKHSKSFYQISILLLLCFISACNTTKDVSSKPTVKEAVLFTEDDNTIIPLEDRSRRKWDSAIVADLDQDGHQDMILMEHGHNVQVYWNNNGKFSKPFELLMGDLHGVTISDYDNDGLINLIVVQGGGGGSKPRNPLIYTVKRNRTIEGGDQLPDIEKMRGRSAKLVDADGNGILDLLLTGFPTPEQMELGANNFHENNGNGDFNFLEKLPHGNRLSYKTLVTDFNNDNDPDFIFYGGTNIIAVKAEDGMKFSKAENNVLGEASNAKEASSISEIDFDNDGDFDLFITRNQHSFHPETFFDAENKRFAFFTRFEPFKYEDIKIDGDFKLENLQMAYPHFDVFVGKNKRLLEFKGDSHGHKDFTLSQKEAEGFPDEMKDKGLYIGYVGDGFWRIAGDTKSPTAGVVHNVLSTPKTEPIELMPAMLLENRDGVFVDVTAEMGISIPEQTTSAAVGDFDNDGWSDLFVVRYGSPASVDEEILLMNQQGKSFVAAKNHGLISKELGSTGGHAQTIDHDNDGDLDIIYSNERGGWHFYSNNSSNNNNHIVVNVGKSPKGNKQQSTAFGAILTFKACGNTYSRVVGASSSPYSQGFNTFLHVGLGSCDKIEDAKIRWTNGEELEFDIKELNTSIFVGER